MAQLAEWLLPTPEVCSSNPATCPFWTNHILEILLNGSNKTMQGTDYWKVSLQVVCLEKAEVGKSEDFFSYHKLLFLLTFVETTAPHAINRQGKGVTAVKLLFNVQFCSTYLPMYYKGDLTYLAPTDCYFFSVFSLG